MPSAGARPRALAAGRVRRPLCPLPKPVLQWRPPGGLRELSRLPQSPFPPSMTIPKRPVAKAGARQELREKLCARGARGGRLAPAGLPCHGVSRGLPLAARPGLAWPAAWPGPLGDLLLEGRARYLHAVFTFEALAAVVGHLVANEVGLPVEGLGALVTLVLSLLRVDDHVLLQAAQGAQGSRPGPSAPAARRRGALGPAWPVLSGGHGGQHSLLRGQSASWHASVHCPSGQASGMEAQRRPSGASSGPF